MIRLEGLGKRFEKKWALHHITMEVREGELFGLIGPNGAGKSTMIKILAALEFPTLGQAFIEGINSSEEPFKIRSRIGYMPELFGLYDELVVEEYLEFFARLYQIPRHKRESLLADLMSLMDLEKLAQEEVKNLSKGVRQRLYLAKILIPDTKVLLLDEPASGLDPRARVEFRAILFELQKSGKTILISSHILSELQDICNRVAIIENGKLLLHGTVQEIIQQRTSCLKIKIKVRSPSLKEVENHLKAFPFKGFTLEKEYLLGEFYGEEEEIPRIHRSLVQHGVEVFSFQVMEGALEDIFMSITQGELR
jgi:ABC-2 type transport system ATP-binding protein